MPTLEAFLQIIGGATGSGAVLGLWLYLTLKKLTLAEAKIEALNAKIEARDALRLSDHQGPLRDVAEALLASDREPEDEQPAARRPTGGHRR